jgi:DNA-binding beta-propeller fold protein YncE
MTMLSFLRSTPRILAAAVALALSYSAAPAAEIEWEFLRGLNTGSRPLDVALSADGKQVFVLTEDGTVFLFGADGTPTGQIAVGPQAERIAVDPDGERLFVTNRQAKRVDVVQIDILRTISLTEAPSKGNENAPVVIAVFSDFQ